jgi:O-antigen/teichoic acid export membrane protein
MTRQQNGRSDAVLGRQRAGANSGVGPRHARGRTPARRHRTHGLIAAISLYAAPLMNARALRRIDRVVVRSGFARTVARTAGFNIAAMFAAGLGGVVIARAVGPAVCGKYAAITAWFGIAVMIGSVGQPVAVGFHVAREPLRAHDYLATSRTIVLATSVTVFAAGMLLAPVLAHGNASMAAAYRIVFVAVVIAVIGGTYTSSLCAREISRWNVARTVQPLINLAAILVLWRLRLLTLDVVLVVLASTMLVQLCWSYWSCRRTGLTPGRPSAALVRPLAVYGAAQIAVLTPAALNEQLDQLVLSQTVPAADLGRYAIAVSLTLLPLPLVSAIGYVAFPRLASERELTPETRRLQRSAILGSAGLAVMTLVPLAVVSPWLVPFVFGAAYRGAVPLVWILAPGALFLTCGQVVGNLLGGRNHPGVVARAQGLALISTLALLFALLPFLGVYAAAIASTIAYGISAGFMLHGLLRLPTDPGVTPTTGASAQILVTEPSTIQRPHPTAVRRPA